MSNLFKVKTPAPDPRIKADETERRKQIQARGKARRTGGMRSLISMSRDEAQAGLDPLSKDI
jgi:hypothetical protein